MKAELLLHERHQLNSATFVELRIWNVPSPVKGSKHQLKYSLAYVVDGKCVLRYDNEAGKGDHKHIGSEEKDYSFTTAEQLLLDFWADIDEWKKNEHSDTFNRNT